ncbi:GNAT family N-acetyltransferase [Aurantiacibacter sp. D1-12]|uniref:GNAT family N-acetyltransferase n=1 Tax=Aurantiacibacter sp. D1-12 TaxID=2993658 RepID=UPI00237C774B|nr:GNAT family N-acetyltransferase [Aurantiacibacter sp. D1-12]MDE1468048.1 GNAT family N-acetyltransferase [Aurantiacibacter sp. D1-12]
MAAIEITRVIEEAKGAYYADVEGTDVKAELTWVERNGIRNANHTFTPPQARGKGIAFKLVEALIADAREQGFKVNPSCPYVAAQFDKQPDWADLRA